MKRAEPLEYNPVIHGYSVALGNKYDIYRVKDVVKILKWIRHKDTSIDFAREFFKQLIAFELFTRMALEAEGIKIEGKMTIEKLMKAGVVSSKYYSK